jgi:hypothetical protein
VDGVTTDYILDGDQVVLELTGSSVTAVYVRGMNLVYSVVGSEASYYCTTATATWYSLQNASGAVTQEYDYDAFGNEKDPDENDTNPFRYCGEYYDAETGRTILGRGTMIRCG